MSQQDDRYVPRVPASVFYRGRRQSRRTNSFKPAHETQAAIEADRKRQQSRKSK